MIFIEINNNKYVASGVAFEYKNQTYKLCLLTGKGAILDNNSYMQIKIQMQTYVIILLFVLIITAMYLAHSLRKMQKKNAASQNTIAQLNGMVSKMNNKLLEKDFYDTRNNVWSSSAIMPFLDKLIARDAYPVTFMHIACVDNSEREKFIARANYILDKNVLRFAYDDRDVVLIFVGMNRRHSRLSIQLLMEESMQIMYAMTIKKKDDVDKLRIKYDET